MRLSRDQTETTSLITRSENKWKGVLSILWEEEEKRAGRISCNEISMQNNSILTQKFKTKAQNSMKQ